MPCCSPWLVSLSIGKGGVLRSNGGFPGDFEYPEAQGACSLQKQKMLGPHFPSMVEELRSLLFPSVLGNEPVILDSESEGRIRAKCYLRMRPFLSNGRAADFCQV